jgi:GDP-L-fucose synthase
MNLESKILITGATGLSGSAIHKKLIDKGYKNILKPDREELDLSNVSAVNNYFKEHKPEYVYHCAGEISTHLTHHTEPYPIFAGDKAVIHKDNESYEMSGGGSYEMSGGGSYEMSGGGSYEMSGGGSYEMSGGAEYEGKELYSKKPIKTVTLEDTKQRNFKSGSKTELKVINSEVLSKDAYINLNTINAASANGVKKVIAVGSCWNYPRLQRAINETDYTETSSQGTTGHDVSKFLLISLLKHLKNEKTMDSTVLMIPPLYGDHTHENINEKHVFAYLNNNMYVAARQELDEITLSSNGSNLRQFIHQEDFGNAALMAMELDAPLVNVANDKVFSIEDVAKWLADRWGYTGKIKWENQPSNAGPQILDCTLLKEAGWKPEISLIDTIENRLE